MLVMWPELVTICYRAPSLRAAVKGLSFKVLGFG